jgi:hypothetical protein
MHHRWWMREVGEVKPLAYTSPRGTRTSYSEKRKKKRAATTGVILLRLLAEEVVWKGGRCSDGTHGTKKQKQNKYGRWIGRERRGWGIVCALRAFVCDAIQTVEHTHTQTHTRPGYAGSSAPQMRLFHSARSCAAKHTFGLTRGRARASAARRL